MKKLAVMRSTAQKQMAQNKMILSFLSHNTSNTLLVLTGLIFFDQLSKWIKIDIRAALFVSEDTGKRCATIFNDAKQMFQNNKNIMKILSHNTSKTLLVLTGSFF